jgi:hypothetical protein
MTNRERARTWLLDTYPSAWEAEHVQSLASLLDEVVLLTAKETRARQREADARYLREESQDPASWSSAQCKAFLVLAENLDAHAKAERLGG